MKKYTTMARTLLKNLFTQWPIQRCDMAELWRDLSNCLWILYTTAIRVAVILTAPVSIPFIAYIAVRRYELDEDRRAAAESEL
jgi:hypothetical protein